MKENRYLNIIIVIISIILVAECVVIGTTAVASAKKKTAETNSNAIASTQNGENNDNLTEEERKEKEKLEAIEKLKDENEKIDISEIDGFYIKVNYQENVVTIYIKDDEGNYTRPYKAMVCSTGKATPTSGVYKMSDRGKWGMMVGRVWAQYYSRIDDQILFHSVPYQYKSASSLEYWEYDKLGTTASAGCVRLTVEDSKWIFENCPAGTQVEFYADSDPGPLGKPEAAKISNAPENMRGWDPTDPDETNPWLEY